MLPRGRHLTNASAICVLAAALLPMACGETLVVAPDPVPTTDAGLDAQGSDALDSGPVVSFCSKHPLGGSVVLCHDFDEVTTFSPPWESRAEAGVATLDLTTSGATSPPNALLVTMRDVAGDRPATFLTIAHAFKKRHRRLSFSFTVKALLRPTRDGGAQTNLAAVFARIDVGGDRSAALGLDVDVLTGAPTLDLLRALPSGNIAHAPLLPAPPLQVDTPHRLQLDIAHATSSGNDSGLGEDITASVDGTLLGSLSFPTISDGPTTVEIGGRVDSPDATFVGVFDDVLIEDVD